MTNEHTPKVSVIIPIYNTEPYLRECLNSIISQTLKDIEIICVDDGSTDGSPAILEEYRQKDSRITIISQENQGQSAARNRGMDAAYGEYIYFIDSDDYVDLTLLEKTTALADELKLDILVFGLEQFMDSDEVPKEFNYEVRLEENSPEVLSGVEYMKWANDNKAYALVVVAQLWRKSFLTENELRFQEGMIYEDPLFSFQAYMAAQRVYQITYIFYHYRRWYDSTTIKPRTNKNVESAFACTHGILRYAFRESNTPEENYEIWRLYNQYAKVTRRYYLGLSAEEKEKVVFDNEMENELFRQMIVSNSVSDKDLRLLHRIKWLPGKIRYVRKHGVFYTIKRVVERLAGRKRLAD